MIVSQVHVSSPHRSQHMPPSPDFCYKCSFCMSSQKTTFNCLNLRYGLYNTGRSHRTLTTIGLIYRWGLHHWEFESVWKCLKATESVIKWNRLYCTYILLVLLRIHRSIFERVCCLPEIKTTKGSTSTVWGSRLNKTGQGLALMAISWNQRVSCHVLRIIFGV